MRERKAQARRRPHLLSDDDPGHCASETETHKGGLGVVTLQGKEATTSGRRGRPVVEAIGVDKVYANGTIALKAADLIVREREFVSLLGPSGCGKSTLLRIMAGLSEASSGQVRWWEQGYDVVGQKHRKVSFVFQNATSDALGAVAQEYTVAAGPGRSGAGAECTGRRSGVGHGGIKRICGSLSARAVWRHANARVDCARNRHGT